MEIIALVLFVWLLFVRLVARHSIIVGSVTLARCQTEWGPFLTNSENYNSRSLLHTINKKIVPRFSEWIAESRAMLNSLFITGVLTVSVGLLTYFNITNNGAIYPYTLLIVMMMIAHTLVLIGWYVTSKRVMKMSTTHNLLLDIVQALNIVQVAENVPEEAEQSVERIAAVIADRDLWERLTTDIVTEEED